MKAATRNTSQPKTALFQWLALQRPIRAARLFELLRGDIVVCSLRGLSGNERARAADVVDAPARRVRVWVMEGVEGLGGIDLDVEVVAALGVENGHLYAVRLRLPEQRDLEAVVRAVIQLVCRRDVHVCLLSPLHHGSSVSSRAPRNDPADMCLEVWQRTEEGFGKSNWSGGRRARLGMSRVGMAAVE